MLVHALPLLDLFLLLLHDALFGPVMLTLPPDDRAPQRILGWRNPRGASKQFNHRLRQAFAAGLMFSKILLVVLPRLRHPVASYNWSRTG